MKALILDNNVVDVVATEFDVHSSLTWMDCTDDCKVGWTVVSGKLTEPTEPSNAPGGITHTAYFNSYGYKRKQKYKTLNQDEMRYDDLINSTTTWQDAIAAIKAEFPKP